MKLSIITVNLNDAKGLLRTIESVQQQSFKDFEHIVIDGNSTDGSPKVIEENSDYFTYWISEPDQGIYDAMNKGIKVAKGKYLLFLNSGDVLFNNDTLRQVQSALHQDIDVIYGNLWIVDEDNKGFTNQYATVADLLFLKKTSLGHGAAFIKRELFFKYGFYRIDLKIVSDWAFFFKVLAIEKVSQMKIDIKISKFHMGGISTSIEHEKLHRAERKKVLMEYFDIYDQTMDEFIGDFYEQNRLLSHFNGNIAIITTNRIFLNWLNAIISLMVTLLKLKRK